MCVVIVHCSGEDLVQLDLGMTIKSENLEQKISVEISGRRKSKCHYLVLQVFPLQLIISQMQISLERVVLDLFTRYDYP